MKKGLLLVVFCGLMACAEYIEAPKNKLSKDEMINLIAELSLNEQTLGVNPKGSTEEGVFALFNKYGITGKDFTDNYTYYLAKKQMPQILEKAQQKIKEMHPKAEDYIENHNKTSNFEQIPER